MERDNDRIKRIEEYLLDPEKVIFETLNEFQDAVRDLTVALSNINTSELELLRGEDGKTPERGVDYMTDADIAALEAFILGNMPVVGLDLPSIEQMQEFVRGEVAKIPRVKGDKGDPGKPGKPGKDGSPDSGAEILRKLRELGKNQGLQIKDVRGLENRIKFYNTAIDEFYALKEAFENQRIVLPTNTGGGGSTPGSTAWGSITGTLSDQTDLQNALNAKQDTLVSGTNIKTINGTSLLGSGDIVIGGSVAWGAISGTLSDQTDLQNALDAKLSITDAASTYLTIANAASTYLTQANASSTYLTQANAASTYLTQAAAASTYYPASNPNGYTSNTGTVTSVAASVPTGLTISGSPVTGAGTLAIALDTGYVIPTQAALDAKADLSIPINTQTDNYTLALADAGGLVELNHADPKTITVPKNSVIAFPIGTIIRVRQMGAGQVTLAPVDGDVTLLSFDNALKLVGENAMCVLIKRATDEWAVEGNVEA